MNDPENFLSRWSRRKLETGSEKAAEPAPENPVAPAAQDAESGRAVDGRTTDAKGAPAPEFDVDSLPSLDSIGASSDIGAFLQKGVPSTIRNAALRRAWTADPAIRDFVGLEENAWDFTDPNAMEGFGALDPDIDVQKLVDDIFRDKKVESAQSESPPDGQTAAQTEQAEHSAAGAAGDSPPGEIDSGSRKGERLAALPDASPMVHREENIAPQPENFLPDNAVTKVGREPDDSD